ncbi:MAG: hypothetical protein ACK56I_29995, partial [bacterium]
HMHVEVADGVDSEMVALACKQAMPAMPTLARIQALLVALAPRGCGVGRSRGARALTLVHPRAVERLHQRHHERSCERTRTPLPTVAPTAALVHDGARNSERKGGR